MNVPASLRFRDCPNFHRVFGCPSRDLTSYACSNSGLRASVRSVRPDVGAPTTTADGRAPGRLRYWPQSPMNPSRKRKIRLVVALTAAVLLSSALVYTSFSASSEAVGPGKLINDGRAGVTYKLVGKVKPGTLVVRPDGTRTFEIMDRDGRPFAVKVTYASPVPDPFREGREVSVVVKQSGDVWEGQKDSLVTKCPSKYTAA